MPVNLIINRTVSFFSDQDENGQFDPGDTIYTRVTIQNTGDTAATGVTVEDNFVNDTQFGVTTSPMTLNVSPIAFNDTFTAVGNTVLRVGPSATNFGTGPSVEIAGSLLANDRGSASFGTGIIVGDATPGFTIDTVVNAATVGGGRVTIFSDGSFTYVSQAGDANALQNPVQAGDTLPSDTFTYTIRDVGLDGMANTADDLTSTATAKILLNGEAWYVNATTGNDTTGTGTSDNPYKTMTALNGVTGDGTSNDDVDGTGDTIYLQGTVTGPIVLEDSQLLIGQGADLAVNGIAIETAIGNSAITASTGSYAVTVNANNTIAGLNITGTSTVGGISDNVAGSFGTLNLNPAALNAGNPTYATTITANGAALLLSEGTIAGNGFSNTTSDGGNNNVSLTNINGTVILGTGTMTNGSVISFAVNGGNANIDYNGTITKTSNGRVIDIQNKTDGNVSFDGAISSTSTSDGIRLLNNALTDFSFTGGMTLTTSSSGTTAFEATGLAGSNSTLVVTGTNTISSGAGQALIITNTNIAAADVTFQSINATAGANNGIHLSNTGLAGGLHVTGTGAAGSGGTITGRTGADASLTAGTGIYLNNTADVSLDRMIISNNQNFGIHGVDVHGFTLNNSTVSDNGNNSTGDEGGVFFANSSGTLNILNSTLTGGFDDNLRILYDSATADTAVWNITNNDFLDLGAGQNAMINLRSATSASASTNVTYNIGSPTDLSLANLFDNSANQNVLPPPDTQWFGDGILVTFEGPFQHNINIDKNTFFELFQAIDFAVNFSADTTARIYDNTITYTEGVAAIAFGTASSSTAQMLFQILIEDNDIGGLGNNSGSRLGNGIVGDFRGAEISRVTLHQNVIRDTEVGGIRIISQALTDGDTHLRITNNIVDSIDDDFGGGTVNGMEVTTNADTNGDIFLTINGNDSSNIGGSAVNAYDIRIRQAELDNTFALEDFAGTGTSDVSVEAYLVANNPTAAGNVDVRTGGSVVNYTTMNQNNANTPAPFTPVLADAPPPADDSSTDTGGTDPEGGEIPNPPAETDGGPVVVDDGLLSQSELDLIVDAAIQRWADAGATDAQLAAMRAVAVSVSNLGGLTLGSSDAGTIMLDDDAAGWRWFVDETPGDDSEFSGTGTRLAATSPTGLAGTRMDLLTVVTHELGHQIGLTDSYDAGDRDELMYGTVSAGERRLPGDGDLDGATGVAVDGAFAVSPISIGTLPAGQTVTIEWRSVVNVPGEDQPAPYIIGQTTVAGSNFSTVQSDANPGLAGAQLYLQQVDAVRVSGFLYTDVNKDGDFDAGTDTILSGVTLLLFADTNNDGNYDQGTDLAVVYQDANNNNVYDAGDTPLAAGSTGAGVKQMTATSALVTGGYSFTNLAPGDYIVVVPASNFGGVPLGNKVAHGNPADPNAGFIPLDNNAEQFLAGQAGLTYAATRAVRLDYGLENAAGPTGNALDTNDTLALGFDDPNLPPAIGALQGDSVTHVEDGGPTALDNGNDATVSDGDSLDGNFGGGTLTAQVTTNRIDSEDTLLVKDGGNISVDFLNSKINYSGVEMATFTGGSGGAPLVITFNATATIARVQELMRLIAYENVNSANPNAAVRTVTLTLVDGDGRANGGDDDVSVTTTVNITPVNDSPTGDDNTKTINEDATYTFVYVPGGTNDFNFSDVDGGTFAGVRITTLPGAGTLTLNNVAVVDEQVISAADVQAGLLKFTPAPNASGNDYATIGFQVIDNGSNVAPNDNEDDFENLFVFDVTALNDAPRVSVVPPTSATTGGQVMVNTTATGAQESASSAGLVGGGYVIAWSGNGTGDAQGVFVQRYNAAGAAQGSEILVNATTTSGQISPAVAALTAGDGGGYVVVWQGNGPGDTLGIFAQRYNSSGAAQGGETLVNTTVANSQIAPSVVALTGGGYVVTWSGNGPGDAAGVFVQRFNSAGQADGGEVRANATVAGTQGLPAVGALRDGGYVVTWEGAGPGDSTGIYAQRYNASGVAQGGEVRVNTSLANFQVAPSVAGLVGGGYVIVWSGDGASDSSDSGVFSQRYDASGNPVGGEERVTNSTLTNQMNPSVSALPGGGYVVSWFGYGTGDSWGIFSRTFDATGVAQVNETMANSPVNSPDQPLGPSVAGLSHGGYVVAWHTSEVLSRHFAPAAAVEQIAHSLKGTISLSDVDAGSATLTATLSVGYGVLNVGLGGSGASIVTGNGTGTVTVSGTSAQLQALLSTDATSTLTYTANTDAPPASTTLTVTVNDGGATGQDPGLSGDGTSEQGSATHTITITPVNDAPTVGVGGEVLAPANEDSVSNDPADHQSVEQIFDDQFSDVDGDTLAGVAVVGNDASGTNGQWQYWTGATWTDIGAASPDLAVALAAATKVRFLPNLDYIGDAPTLTVRLVDSSGGALTSGATVDTDPNGGTTRYSSGVVTLDQNIAAVIDHPVLDLDGAGGANTAVGYLVEQDPTGTGSIAPDATVTDADSANFDTGTLVVGFTANSQAGDVIELPAFSGDATHEVAIDGAQVKYNNVVVGTYAAGDHDTALSITFNDQATAEAVQWVVRGVRVVHTGDAPSTAVRTLNYALTDGDGGSTSSNATVNVQPANDAPASTAPTSATIAFTENAGVSTPLMQGVVLSDVDLPANFAGGSFNLNVSGGEGGINLKAGSLFSIVADGIGGFDLVYDDAGTPRVIGKITGFGTANMSVSALTGEATLARLNDLVDDFGYILVGDNPTPGDKIVTMTFNDGNNVGAGADVALTTVETQTLTVTATNDVPVLDLDDTDASFDSAAAYAENDPTVLLAPNAAVTDLDDVAMEAATVTISAGRVTGDQLTLGGLASGNTGTGGAIAFSYDDTTGILTLTGTASKADYQAALRLVGFVSSSDAPGTSRTITWVVNDGTAPGTSRTTAITVTPSEDLPVAQNDADSTTEAATKQIAILGNDSDADGPAPAVAEIDGQAISAGQTITLTGSGAKVTLNNDGTITYDPNGKFNQLTAPGSGAVNTSAVDTFTYKLVGAASTANVSVTVNGLVSSDDRLLGDSGDNVITGTPQRDFFMVQQGGNDTIHALAGNDTIYFGAAFTPGDTVNGGDGADSIILQGNYNVAFGTAVTSNISGIDSISLAPGNFTDWGDTANNFYDYNLTMLDANTDAGAVMKINGFYLRAGEDLIVNGAAETNGKFFIFAGQGVDNLTGGNGNDVFVFGHDGRLGNADTVVGGAGYDSVYLRGDYSIDFTAGGFTGSLSGIESITLGWAADTQFIVGGDGEFDYNIVWDDAMLGDTATITVNGSGLSAAETMLFNGSDEAGGHFRLWGGAALDTLTGGGGNDLFVGGLGWDTLQGNGGADTFRYYDTAESSITPGTFDQINGFTHLVDKIDLFYIDANANVAGDQAFTFIGNAAFSAPGQLRAVLINAGTNTWQVEANTGGNGTPEMLIRVQVEAGQPLTAADFFL